MRVFKQTNKQIDMKNKLLAVLATLGMVASASAVKVNDNLSINGFIDGSYLHDDLTVLLHMMTQASGIDEVELNFLRNAGNVSGEFTLTTSMLTARRDLDIEQAHFTYSSQRCLLYMLVALVLHLVSSVKIQLVFTLSAVLTVTWSFQLR